MKWAAMFKTLLREPLLHFGVLSGLLFVVLDVNPSSASGAGDGTIQVDTQLLSALRSGFLAQHQRAPDADEINGLVKDYIEEEALVRQARRLGLDQEDPVIRRRLVQKMQFLFQDFEDDAPAQAYRDFYQQHQARYQRPATMDFEQIFFAHSAPEGFNPGNPGDAFPLGRQFTEAQSVSIERWFGAGFYARLATLPLQQWQGPVQSVYGVHFVKVSQRLEAVQLPYEAVTDKVKADYWQEQRTLKREREIAQIVAEQPVHVDAELQSMISLTESMP